MDVARYLVRLAERDDEHEPMTQKRLYKLLYYVQGWHLAWYGRPMFADRIEAWQQGPVPADLYPYFRQFGRDPIPPMADPQGISEADARVIEHVWRHYRQWSAAGLSQMTHREPPWKNAFNPDDDGRCSNVITHEAMKAFFGEEYHKSTGEPHGHAAKVQADIAAGRTIPHEEVVRQLGW